ncbi:MAG: ATP-binding cassette domain-containing protein [Alphaproteobacteria bacterium]|nr:ATP-binding cassette domain-containing protein [Alphaproteobacteria bacterium]
MRAVARAGRAGGGAVTAAPLLELRDVRCDFSVERGFLRARRTLRAVDGVSLALRPGETLGIVGESGCGKSTVANLMLGLIRPSAGAVLLSGTPIDRMDRRAVAQRVQPVFQDPYASLNPRKTVRAIVGLPLSVHGAAADPGDAARRVSAMLDMVGLPRHLADSYPGELSGGQRQRVAIARALVLRPNIVVCDEPTSALDVSVQAQILNLLLDLRRELGLAMVFISHNLAVVEHVAQRVAVMYLGRVVEEATAAALFRAARHPYTQALLLSVLTPEPGRGIPDARLGAGFPDPLAPPPGCSFHPRCPLAEARCAATAPALAGRGEGEGTVACHVAGALNSAMP